MIAVLLGRAPAARAPQAGTAAAPSSPSAEMGTASPALNPPPAVANKPGTAAIVRGKVGQRVESAGLAITVVGVTNEPRYKEVTAPPASQKFIGVEVLLENTGTQGHGYFSTNFRVKDPQDRAYTSGALGVADPPLGWGTIVPGEKVRGHVAFVVPKDATGLTLAYVPPSGGPADYRPIHIELGQ